MAKDTAPATDADSRVDMETFIKTLVAVHASGGTIEDVADKLGLEVESVQARASSYRSDGIPLPNFRKSGGGRKRNTEEALKILAKAMNKPVEELQKDGEKLHAASVARKEKRAEKAKTQTASA